MAVNYDALLDRIGIASDLDLVVGGLTIVAVLEATRRAFGWAIPSFAVLMLLYAYFGPYMPGLLQHGGFSAARLIASTTTYLTGVFSSILGISATLVAIFMIFGGFLNASYASNFFVRLALQLTRNTRAGSALAAVGANRSVRLHQRIAGRQRHHDGNLHHSAHEAARLQRAVRERQPKR